MAAQLRALALASGLGVLLRLACEGVGTSPRVALMSCLAALLGLALESLLPAPSGRRGSWLALAVAGLACAVLGGALGGAQASVTGIFLAVGAGAALVSRALGGGASGRALILSGPLVPLALLHPIVGIAVALLIVAALDLRAEPWRSGAAREPWQLQLSSLLELLLASLGAYLFAASAFAARAHLDPTPLGFAMALGVAISAAGLAPRRAPGEARWVIGAVAAALSIAAVGLLPLMSFKLVTPLAGAADPRLQLALLLALVVAPGGFAAGLARPAGPLLPAGLALGLYFGADSGADARGAMLALGVLAALGAIALGERWLWRSLGALAIALFAALGLRLAPWDEPALLRGATVAFRDVSAPDDLARALSKLSPAAGGWGPDGSTLVYTRGSEVERTFIDGLSLERDSRAADAERIVGALGAALAATPHSALVLGEAQGLVTEGLLEQGLERVTVAVADPDGLRARAALDPALGAVLLHPAARLRHVPKELLVRSGEPTDLIIELAQTVYVDGNQGLPSPLQLSARRALLSPGGVYILVVPAHRLSAEGLRGLVGAFAERFPMAMAALPPGGVDELILCGWSTPRPLSWASFVEASTRGLGSLTRVGVRGAADLADRLIADREGLLRVAGAELPSPPQRLGLPDNLADRPSMVLPLFADALADPEQVFGPDLDPGSLAQLRQRRDINRDLLTLLDDAARGDVRRIYEQSQALTGDPAGQRALNPLVRPYLERASALITKGIDAGPNSNVWSLCLRETEAARMLDPLSADVNAMSGKCHLAAGDARSAEIDFNEALKLDKGHEQALLGLAQVLVSRGDAGRAEQALREAVKYNPQSWRPRYHLGALLLDLDRTDEAEEMLSQARTLAGDRSALPYGALAHVALRRGDPNAALVYAERAVALDPVAKHLHLRGLAYFELGQMDQAERDFKDAIYTDPKWWPARGDLGRILAMRGDYGAAAQAFTEVLNADPGNPGARENLRRVEEKLAAEKAVEPE